MKKREDKYEREKKERENLKEENKRREEHRAQIERRMVTIGVLEACLFAGIVGLHMALSAMQRDYTGFYLATNNFFNSIVNGTDFMTVVDVCPQLID